MAMLNIGEDQQLGFQCENHELTATEIEELILSLLVPNGDGPPSPGSDSQGSNRTTTPTNSSTNDDDRKLRRMISNRDSARRSRCRKKRHLDDLTNEVNRFMIQNRDLKDRLGRVLNRRHMVERQNDWLRMESVGLRARLSDLCRILAAMQ